MKFLKMNDQTKKKQGGILCAICTILILFSALLTNLLSTAFYK